MDGLGRLKQAAALFIQVRRGFLDRAFDMRAFSRCTPCIERECITNPISLRAHNLEILCVSIASRQRMSEAVALGWALSAERRGGFAAMQIQHVEFARRAKVLGESFRGEQPRNQEADRTARTARPVFGNRH